jgi:hypothetical protein
LNICSLFLDSQAEAADGLGWNSRFSQPIQCRWMLTDVEDQNCKIWELEKQLADKNKEISYWKTAAGSSRENQLRFESTREKFDQFLASLSRDIEDFLNTFGCAIVVIIVVLLLLYNGYDGYFNGDLNI